MLKKKQAIVIYILMLVLIAAYAFYVYRDKKGETNGELKWDYIPCVSLKENETVDIEIPQNLHGSRTAGQCAHSLLSEGRCEEAWVNGKGNCVARMNQSQVQNEYNRAVKEINSEKQAYDERGTIAFDISYDCRNITYYINDNTEFMNFWGATWTLPLSCIEVQLYAGVPLDDTDVHLKIIYPPTGKTVFEVNYWEFTDPIDEEKWNSLVEEAKKE